MTSVSLALRASAALELRRRHRAQADESGAPSVADLSFLQWCEELGRHGMQVDGHPFDLGSRPALREIYATVPSTKAEGYNTLMAIMKGAQTGLSVLSFLLQIYLILKYAPVKVGSYYPDRGLAAYMSSSRFLPVLRSIPQAHRALLASNDGAEGNVMTRRIGKSEVLFLWTSGSAATESFPLGAIVADEVQNMLTDDIERIKERMSASDVRFFFACSTAKWPGADIDHLFMQGDQRRFHSRCDCPDGVILDETFPACVQFNDGRWPDAPRDYVYCCPACGAWVRDPQAGTWVRHNPNSRQISFHFPQTLSPMVSAREIMEAYTTAQDLQNFFNRKLGKPWTDPTQVPVTLAHCEAAAAEGHRIGLKWETSGRGTLCGIDQMGGWNAVIIKRRLPDGRQAVVHVEAIFAEEPFTRCSELMQQFGVEVCVVETLPNVNSARAFANRHRGRVFLAGYADLRDDAMVWGDTVNRSDRRTADDERTKYTVSLNQYRVMQTSLYRVRDLKCLFPRPEALAQEVIEKGVKKRILILRDWVFLHLTKTALVVEQDEETRRPRAKVRKIGLDPHFAFANMLCDVAWARVHGSSSFIFPDEAPVSSVAATVERNMPGLPTGVLRLIEDAPANSCGRCEAFRDGRCEARDFKVEKNDPACPLFVASG